MQTMIPKPESDSDNPPPKRRGRPPGFKGTANRPIDYTCMTCKQPKTREELLVRRVSWAEMGRNGKPIRSRSVGWQCRACVEADPDFNRQAFLDAPGIKVETDAKHSA